MDINPAEHVVERIQAGAVQTGYSLAIPTDDGRYQLFQVERVGFSFKAGEAGKITLTSEPVDGGEPWVLEFGPGEYVIRVSRRPRT